MFHVKVPAVAAAVAVSAALGGALTACGSDDSTTSGPTSSSSVAMTTASAAQTSTPASGGLASKVSIDANAIDGKFTTTCTKQGDMLALAIEELDNATYGRLAVSATLQSSDDTVSAVQIAGTKGGPGGGPLAVGFTAGVAGGSANGENDGTIYRVTGEGVGAPDPSNPTVGVSNVGFEIIFACDAVVGG